MTRLEDWQSPERQPLNATAALRLSQSTQEMFKPNSNFAGQAELCQALDFGAGPDLYRSAAYTGGRLSASTFMADELEQKPELKIQTPWDSLLRPGVIRTKEEETIWAKMQDVHKLGQDESATHIGLTPEVIAEMRKKGQANKLEFFDSAAEGALDALQHPKEKQTLLASNLDSKNDNQVVSDMTRGAAMSGTLLPELWMVKLGVELSGPLTEIALNVTAAKFQEILDAVKKAVVNPIEHPFRGHELESLSLIPENSWSDAYRAFPDIAKLGGLSEHDTARLMKVIVANELKFFGPEDKAQDVLVGLGQGSHIADKSIGFAQITTLGIKNLSAELDKQVAAGELKVNPLHKFAAMENSVLAKELLKPENVPLFVAAHINHNVRMLKNHSPEVSMTLEALGYQFNADMRYTKENKHLITKNEAIKKGIPSDSALPTDEVLSKSEHAKNIREWLTKIL